MFELTVILAEVWRVTMIFVKVTQNHIVTEILSNSPSIKTYTWF